MNLKPLQKILERLHQPDLLTECNDLSSHELTSVEQQLLSIDIEILLQQKNLLLETKHLPLSPMPLDHVIHSNSISQSSKGLDLLKAGKVGAVLVAGGQGTRLGFDGPKGMFPITPVLHKTLFQYFAEKLKSASKLASFPLKLSIMTSPINHDETVSHFIDANYFGNDPSQISFFTQKTLPLLTEKGSLFFEDKAKLAFGPDGNGSFAKVFFDSGIGTQWQKEGIESIIFIMIDNPLADPFDLSLIEYHVKESLDITLKCIERRSVDEKVGLVAKINEHIQVLEYTEVNQSDWKARAVDGSLLFNIANTSQFCFNLSFLQKISSQNLPLHKTFKAYQQIKDQKIIPKDKPNAWKFERFIFDVLLFTSRVQVVIYPRELSFAPLKNAEGEDSPFTVRRDLTLLDRRTLESITHKSIPDCCQEIDPAFYYPNNNLLKAWKGRSPPDDRYIEA